MTDTAIGYALIGTGILLVLGIVFAIASRGGGRRVAARPTPPKGVHMPNPSLMPAAIALGGALMGAGLAFRPDGWLANWYVLVPGLLIFLATIVAWVIAANREWRDTEHGSHHDDARAH